MTPTAILARNNVRVSGQGAMAMLFAHGFGCDQSMWRFVAPSFQRDFRTILFDHVGAGRSDPDAYNHVKYNTLDGYAADLVEICSALDLHGAVLVAHSVSAMIGILAAAREPNRFSRLILVGPSPRYIDEGDYVGGFAREDIDGLLELLDGDQAGWAAAMAPTIMGNPDRPELAGELEASFCRVSPEAARQFARVTFTGDNRADLSKVTTRALVLQCSDDPIAPTTVGDYVHRHLVGSELVTLRATGHCPHLSAPAETVAAIEAYLADLVRIPRS